MAFVESISRPEGKFHSKYMSMYVANVFEEEERSLHPFSQVLVAEVASWVSVTVRLEARVKHFPHLPQYHFCLFSNKFIFLGVIFLMRNGSLRA